MQSAKPPYALTYYGGKAVNGTGVGPWIAAQLPKDKHCTYIEPFAGMLGVLLQRPKSRIEIVNDTNKDVVNWWRCVRDRGDELIEKCRLTPNSREELARAFAPESADELERARVFSILLLQGINSGAASKSWRRRFRSGGGMMATFADRLPDIISRIREVNLECVDACELLERVEGEPQCVIYADPPYRDADTSHYGGFELDRERLTATLGKQKGRVAISGYGDEWDHLGWRKEARKFTLQNAVVVGGGNRKDAREEVLWMNYPPAYKGFEL